MKKFLAILGITFFLNITATMAQQADENEYAYGTLVNITDSEIILKEYNYEKEEFVEMTYKIAPDVKVRNTDSLKAITPGNQVEILYSEKDGIKNALVVVLEKNEGVAEGPDVEEETPEATTPEQTEPAAPPATPAPKPEEAKAPELPPAQPAEKTTAAPATETTPSSPATATVQPEEKPASEPANT